MAIEKLTIAKFLDLARQYPVLDVRSPGEYNHAHIPGAQSLPLFTDEERKVVGTAYKQQSRETAIKIGLDYFGVKLKEMVEEAEKIVGSWRLTMGNRQAATNELQTANPPTGHAGCVLVHCWRGGMRSAGVAWLLDLYGFKVYTLAGGYKTYRNWVLAQFDKPYSFNILGGYTGSGKTLLLHELKKEGQSIIDLEGLANHKGSALGALGEKPQPKQEMFENLLAMELSRLQGNDRVWLEDESQRIGNLQIPMPLWYTMRKCPVYFLDIPFEQRLDYLTDEYGKFEKEKLLNAILRIEKRLGGLETKNAVNSLVENNHRECFRILLTYYDKWYSKGLHNRENLPALLNKIPVSCVDTKTNTEKLLSCHSVSL